MPLDYVTRAEWGATPWKGSVYAVPASERTEFFVHYYGGPFPASITGNAIPRQNEAIHLGNGWSGIGYNFVVDQDGVIYEGRGWSLVGAHCPNHNRSGWGVQVAIGGDQKPSAKALAAVRALYDEACERAGRTLAKKGHRDGKATACPGDHLYAWVRAGMPVETKPSVPPRVIDEPEPVADRPVLRRGSQGRHVHTLQGRLDELGFELVNDGDFGPATEAAVKAFQKAAGEPLSGQDGVVGPRTWAALDRGVKAPSRPAQRPSRDMSRDFPPLEVNGVLNRATVGRLESVLGAKRDGVLDTPDPVVIELQRFLNKRGHKLSVDGFGLRQDGRTVYKTTKALQLYLGTPADGVLSTPKSAAVAALQRRLNTGKL